MEKKEQYLTEYVQKKKVATEEQMRDFISLLNEQKLSNKKVIYLVQKSLLLPESFLLVADASGRVVAFNVVDDDMLLSVKATLKESVLEDDSWAKSGDLYLFKRDISGWSVMLGFSTDSFESAVDSELSWLRSYQDDYTESLMLALASIVAFVVMTSLALFLWMIRILKRYRNRIAMSENSLVELRSSLDLEVSRALREQQESLELKIEHAKMLAVSEVVVMMLDSCKEPLVDASKLVEDAARDSSCCDLEELSVQLDDKLEQVSQLFYDFRNFYRPDKQKEYLDISTVVDQALKLVSPSLLLHGIEIDRECKKSLSLQIYRNEFVQIVIAILLNAKDVFVVRNIQNPHIKITCYETGQFVVVSVCDNGGGVDRAVSKDILNNFVTTKSGLGSGTGLHMVDIIMRERLGGSVSFENIDGGVCFFIKIDKS